MLDLPLGFFLLVQDFLQCDKGLFDANGDCSLDILGVPPAVAAPILVVIAGVVYRYFDQKNKNK